MELSSFSENIVVIPYVRNGETVDLSVNIDVFTPDFFREVGKRSEERMNALKAEDKKPKGRKKKGKKRDDLEFFEAEARALEIKREIYAELLSSGVLTAWTVTENEVPIAPSKEVLLKLPPRLVDELWSLCLEAAKTVKKTLVEEGTSANTRGGSPELRVVGQST